MLSGVRKKMEKFDDAQKCSISSPQNLGRGRGPWFPNPCLVKQSIFEDKLDTGNIPFRNYEK